MRTIALTEETRKNVLENLLKRSPSSYGEFEDAVAEIVENVRNNKDAAVFEYTKRFDGADINAGNIKVTKEEIDEAYEQLIRLFWMLSEKHWSTFVNITKNRKNTAGLTANRTEPCLDRKSCRLQKSVSMFRVEKQFILLLF